MSKLHPAYRNIKEQCEIKISSDKDSQLLGIFEKAMSSNYTCIEDLKATIEELKLSHLNEVIELKQKISDLIDQNYKLHQLQKERNDN